MTPRPCRVISVNDDIPDNCTLAGFVYVLIGAGFTRIWQLNNTLLEYVPFIPIVKASGTIEDIEVHL